MLKVLECGEGEGCYWYIYIWIVFFFFFAEKRLSTIKKRSIRILKDLKLKRFACVWPSVSLHHKILLTFGRHNYGTVEVPSRHLRESKVGMKCLFDLFKYCSKRYIILWMFQNMIMITVVTITKLSVKLNSSLSYFMSVYK